MDIQCYRGGVRLTQEDLIVHLAASLRLENVGVLLGAGSSVSAGGQTIKDLWGAFIMTHPDFAAWLTENNFITDEQSRVGEGNSINAPDVEKLLDEIEIAKLDVKRRDIAQAAFGQINDVSTALNQFVVRAAILNPNAWHDRPNIKDFGSHASLLQKLVGARQPGQPSPWVFTTNYDLAIEWSAEASGIHTHTGFTGIHNRIFSPQSFDVGLRNILASGEARFGCNDIYLAKLHGSLTWKLRNGDFYEHSASEMWSDINAVFEHNAPVNESLMVLPRAAKYTQTVGFLSGELFRRFSDFLAKPQSSLLISGYSFGDDHINRLLKSALLNPTIQLIIFVPEFAGYSEQGLDSLKPQLRQLLEIKSPRVTVVGSGPNVHFNEFVKMLPDPMLFDLKEFELREKIRDMGEEP